MTNIIGTHITLSVLEYALLSDNIRGYKKGLIRQKGQKLCFYLNICYYKDNKHFEFFLY